jgi:RNA recognition motif-containing protein
MNIYVGNLSYDVSTEDLRQAFEAYGEASPANIIKDKYSGQPRGFAFVEMPNDGKAQAAIENLNGKDLSGRQIKVSEARPRADRRGPGRCSGSRGRSGFGGGRRY